MVGFGFGRKGSIRRPRTAFAAAKARFQVFARRRFRFHRQGVMVAATTKKFDKDGAGVRLPGLTDLSKQMIGSGNRNPKFQSDPPTVERR